MVSILEGQDGQSPALRQFHEEGHLQEDDGHDQGVEAEENRHHWRFSLWLLLRLAAAIRASHLAAQQRSRPLRPGHNANSLPRCASEEQSELRRMLQLLRGQEAEESEVRLPVQVLGLLQVRRLGL